MTGKLKALGIGLLAVFAMGALSASAASAAEFHSESTHTILDGSALDTQVFKTADREVKCNSANIEEGTIPSSTVSEITIKPAYSSCVTTVEKSEIPSRVTFTGCSYFLTNTTTASKEHYNVHMECVEKSDEIHIEVFAFGKYRPCFTIPAQTSTGGGLAYANSTARIDVNMTVTGIEYTTQTGICGSAAVANNASLSGNITVSGTDTAGQQTGIRFGEEVVGFHSESTHTIMDGAALGAQLVSAPLGTISCDSSSIDESTISGLTSLSLTATLALSKCGTMVGASHVDIRVTSTGCDFLFTNVTAADNEHYLALIKCKEPNNEEIHVEAFVVGKFRPCYTIPAQTPTGGGVAYGNTGGHIDIDATVTGVEYTKEVGLCGPAGTANDMSYSGDITLSGTSTAGKEVSISFG